MRKSIVAVGTATIAVIVVLALMTGIIQITPPGGSPSNTPPVEVSKSSSCIRSAGSLLILADLSGFNDSIAHGAPLNPWPVVQVHTGDYVRFLVCNDDATQAHGFAIETYFEMGVAIPPNTAFTIEFQATIPGSFIIYCNIFCTVHAFMVGRLVVSNS